MGARIYASGPEQSTCETSAVRRRRESHRRATPINPDPWSRRFNEIKCVDLLAGLRNLDPEVFSRAVTIPFRKTTFYVVSREDFIAMKCFPGRAQDIVDARQVMKVADKPPDLDLLRRVTHRFGRPAADRLEQLLNANISG